MSSLREWLTTSATAFIAGAVIGGAIAQFWEWLKHNLKRQRWRKGLYAELIETRRDIDEIIGDVQQRGECAKRLTSDFLAASLLGWCEYDSRVDFLACLSNAHNDIVHTNRMLADFGDRWARQVDPNAQVVYISPTTIPEFGLLPTRPDPGSLLCSLTTTRDSVSELQARLRQKLKWLCNPRRHFPFRIKSPTSTVPDKG